MTGPSRKKGGLGRGLASLIPTGPADGETGPADRGAGMGPRMGDAAADVVLGGPRSAAPAPSAPDVGAVYREIRPGDIEPNPGSPVRCSTTRRWPSWCIRSGNSG